jgi:hypothetical protein
MNLYKLQESVREEGSVIFFLKKNHLSKQNTMFTLRGVLKRVTEVQE